MDNIVCMAIQIRNNASTNTVPVVAFVDLDRTEQIKLFMDINENQKAVPKSLRVTLNADMLWESKDPNERRQLLDQRLHKCWVKNQHLRFGLVLL